MSAEAPGWKVMPAVRRKVRGSESLQDGRVGRKRFNALLDPHPMMIAMMIGYGHLRFLETERV